MSRNQLIDKIVQDLSIFRFVVLVGSSYVGKSALIAEMQKKYPGNQFYLIDGCEKFKRFITKERSKLRALGLKFNYLILDNCDYFNWQDLEILYQIFNRNILVTTSMMVSPKKTNNNKIKINTMYPYSIKEMYSNFDEARKNLEKHMIYGSYPDVLASEDKKEKIFKLSEILEKNLKNEAATSMNLQFNKMVEVLKYFAANVGKNLSYPTLIKALGIEKYELKRYIEFLEKHLIIFTLKSFSRSLPKEMSKAQKFYFWDNGIRNLLINNFNDFSLRNDIEQIWENFCISERLKRNNNYNFEASKYFWKTYDNKEISYLEETYGYLFAYTFSWKKTPDSYPRQFLNAYPNSVFAIVSPEKFWDFVS